MMLRLCVAALTLSLSACATLVTEPDGLSLDDRLERLRALSHWELRGRIAIDTGTDAHQGRFNWWQDGEQLRVLIRGPVGVGGVEISGSADELMIRARGESWRMEDAETELSELLGWWMPISSVRHWLLGAPDARFAAAGEVVANDVITRLDQRAWSLAFSRYAQAEGLLTPRRIELEHAGLALVVTVDDWQTTVPARDGP